MSLDGVGKASGAHEGQQNVEDHHLAIGLWKILSGRKEEEGERGTDT